MEQEKQLTSLPENAYRELKPGEEYTPIMPASSSPREVTPYSVTMGIVMAIVFSAAAAFLGLKVGQVFEAAIPIAIIAVGMGNVMGKKNMLGQNVIIQSIGASSGVIVAGAIFTLPALYILGLDAAFYQVFLSSLFGGLLGIVLLIPFRKYFVKEMHGNTLPRGYGHDRGADLGREGRQPGQTAGRGRSHRRPLRLRGRHVRHVDGVGIDAHLRVGTGGSRQVQGGILAQHVGRRIGPGLHHRIEIRHDHHGGFVPGVVPRRTARRVAGRHDRPGGHGLAAGRDAPDILADPASIFTAENLFAFIGKPLGIGGIAMAGIIGIVKQSKIIRQAVGLAVSELGGATKPPRLR